MSSNYDDDLYHDDDIIVLSDHGLFAPGVPGPPYPFPFDAPFYFSYTFSEFQKTRQGANKKTSGVYSLLLTSPSIPLSGNFGIAHAGNMDEGGVTKPVRIETNVNYEAPQIKAQSEKRPTAMGITITVTVEEVEEGVEYVLYRYDDETKVPTAKFNLLKENAVKAEYFTGRSDGTWTFKEDIMSDDKIFFRCVRVDEQQ